MEWIRYQLRHTGKNIESLEEAEKLYPLESLIKDYWRIVETQCTEVKVDYGSDLDIQKYRSGFRRYGNRFGTGAGTGAGTAAGTVKTQSSSTSNDSLAGEEKSYSDEWYEKCGWNLNNLPNIQGSLLRHITTPINGVNVPWLYVGMLFSSFCWHTEDNYLNSINYNHHGSAKIWYGVPGAHAAQFEKVARANFPLSFKESPDLLHQMNTQISPGLLHSHGVPVYKIVQEPGSFVLTWPQAYHGGFSSGFNVGEAVNFATGTFHQSFHSIVFYCIIIYSLSICLIFYLIHIPADWIPMGSAADESYRNVARRSVFSHTRLLFVLANHMSDVPVVKYRTM